MNNLVLDTSVAIKWFRAPEDESHVDKAQQILHDYLEGRNHLATVELLFYEFGNFLWRLKATPPLERRRLLQVLYSLEIPVFPLNPELAFETLRLSADFDITFYDASFIALSFHLDREFVTADEKLFQKISSLGNIRLLSDV